jgi:hypothetical protein
LDHDIAARRRGKRAIALSAAGGITASVTLTVVLLLPDNEWRVIPVFSFFLISSLLTYTRERHWDDFEAYAGERKERAPQIRRGAFAISRQYLHFQADLAGWPMPTVVALVWATWMFPVLFFGSLWVELLLAVMQGLLTGVSKWQ